MGLDGQPALTPKSLMELDCPLSGTHSRHSPRRSDLCLDRETFCWMGGKLPFFARVKIMDDFAEPATTTVR